MYIQGLNVTFYLLKLLFGNNANLCDFTSGRLNVIKEITYRNWLQDATEIN